jgi:hypothetical protein
VAGSRSRSREQKQELGTRQVVHSTRRSLEKWNEIERDFPFSISHFSFAFSIFFPELDDVRLFAFWDGCFPF